MIKQRKEHTIKFLSYQNQWLQTSIHSIKVTDHPRIHSLHFFQFYDNVTGKA